MLSGIDISDSQPDVDWSKIKTDADFAFIKATEGQTYRCTSFTKARVAAAEKAMPGRIGYYHFARPENNAPEAEARFFVATVRAAGGRHGRNCVLDYEVLKPGGGDDRWVQAWVAEYKRLTGARPIVYGGSILRAGHVSVPDSPLWLAAYVSDAQVKSFIPVGWKDWSIWQFTERGTCKGVPGLVDRNRFRGSARDLAVLLHNDKPKTVEHEFAGH
jgi:lysozyme